MPRISLPCVLASMSLALGTSPALALTMQEAAQINAGIAAQLCFQPGASMRNSVSGFRAAGFTETVERSSVNSDINHVFRAPADTVVVEVYYGEMPEDCSVKSGFLSVSAASAILDGLIPRMYPGFLRKVSFGPPNPVTGQAAQCVSYEDPTNPIGLFIGVGSASGNGCVDDGTSVLFSTYRV